MPESPDEPSATPVLERVHDVALPQDGCIATRQLKAIDVGEDLLRSLVVRGALRRVMRGVYVVGSRTLTERQLLWVALLAGGVGSAISHWSAAALHRLLAAPRGLVWVTTPGRRGERIVTTDMPLEATGLPATIHIVSARADGQSLVTSEIDGITTVDVARALVGLAGLIPSVDVARSRRPKQSPRSPGATTRRARRAPVDVGVREATLRAAWQEADYLNRLRAPALEAVLGRGVTGTEALRRAMADHPIVSDDATSVATKTEFLLLEALLVVGLPRPLTNSALRLPGRTYYPDFLYPGLRLVIEVDGGVHRRASRQRSDRLRDAQMARHGYRVVRIPDFEVTQDALACARRVAVAHAERVADLRLAN